MAAKTHRHQDPYSDKYDKQQNWICWNIVQILLSIVNFAIAILLLVGYYEQFQNKMNQNDTS